MSPCPNVSKVISPNVLGSTEEDVIVRDPSTEVSSVELGVVRSAEKINLIKLDNDENTSIISLV